MCDIRATARRSVRRGRLRARGARTRARGGTPRRPPGPLPAPRRARARGDDPGRGAPRRDGGGRAARRAILAVALVLWVVLRVGSRGTAAAGATLGLVAKKRYLMTPGPTPAPPEVLAATAQPVIHHRGPDFRKLYADSLGRLREVLRTEQEVLLFGGSGSGAMESAVANVCSPGDPVLVVSSGYFGERWASIADAYATEVDHVRYAWGEIPSVADVVARLREHEARAVFLTHSETSTGVVVDPQPFAAAAREAGALSVLDAVSSLGAIPLETDGWGLDVVASGAQKALMTPPGLAMVTASPAAWERSARATAPRYYWDWERTRKGQSTLDAPVTPPVTLVAGLNVALGMLLEEGLEAAFE